LLGKIFNRRKTGALFETGENNFATMQFDVREPGGNPGRLRHCNGYDSQGHCPRAGRRDEARSRSQDTGPTALVSSGRFGALLRKEKDGASPPNDFWRLVEFSSIPRLRRLEVFHFRGTFGFALVSQP
jgi:hypothetical protein